MELLLSKQQATPAIPFSSSSSKRGHNRNAVKQVDLHLRSRQEQHDDEQDQPQMPWEERLSDFARTFYMKVDEAVAAASLLEQQQEAAAAEAPAPGTGTGTITMLQAAFQYDPEEAASPVEQHQKESCNKNALTIMTQQQQQHEDRLLETFQYELTEASKFLAEQLEGCHANAVRLLKKAQETQQESSSLTMTTKTADTTTTTTTSSSDSTTTNDDSSSPAGAAAAADNTDAVDFVEALFKDAEAGLSVASSDFDLHLEADDLQALFTDVQALLHMATETFQTMAAYAESQLAGYRDVSTIITTYSMLVHGKLGGRGQQTTAAAVPVGSSSTKKKSASLVVAPAYHQNLISLIILLLSDIFECLRQMDAQQEQQRRLLQSDNKKWEPPSTFERTTTKYWIQDDEDGTKLLNHVLCHVVKEAPLLVYGQDGSMITVHNKDLLSLAVSTNGNAGDDQGGDATPPPHLAKDMLWDKFATPISSVYFDSPSMDLYRERIKRSEGAQLFRVRWYGHTKPTGTQVVFLELKTHHEKWINSKSIKERVTIQEQDMEIFLDPNPDSPAWAVDSTIPYDMVRNGSPGKFVEDVNNADNNNNQEFLNKAVNLLRQMRSLVLEKRLRPCVRSTYLRAAFQSSSNNALRLTIDRNVTLIDETAVERYPDLQKTEQQGNNNNNNFSWCLADNARLANPQSVIKKVPFPVFEVKLGSAGQEEEDSIPVGIADLIDDQAVIAEATKFSKFLTGAAAFQQDHIESLPYWAENEHFKDVFFFQQEQQHPPASTKPPPSTGNSESSSLADNTGTNNTGPKSILRRSSTISSNDKLLDDVDTRRGSSSVSAISFRSSRNELKSSSPSSIEPFTSISRRRKGSARRSMGSAISITSDLVSFRSSRSFTSNNKNNKGDDKKKKSDVRPKRPARVEPKSYFANERTFIQWISAALLLVTIAVIVLENRLTHPQTVPVAIFLIAAAGAIVMYSMFVYNRRLYLLATGNPYGYVDRCGPLFLALCVLCGVTVLLIHAIRGQQAAVGAENSYLVEGDGCFRHRLDVNDFYYQASDVFVDEDRNLLLVPSMEEISGIDRRYDHEEAAQTQQVLKVEGADLEAITYTDDGRIFALSEEYDGSSILQLRWAEGPESPTHRLIVEHRWYINSKRSEGFAYVPETNGPGKLYVSHNAITDSPGDTGGIHIYDLPDPEVESSIENQIERLRKMNKKTLSFRLRDSKIGGMSYHDGKLYILHDNANVIRIWAVDTGRLLQEITLPIIEGANWQWEGFFFDRHNAGADDVDSKNRGGNIRGSSTPTASQQELLVDGKATNAVLHLSLDSPPQVWSLAVSENAETGGIEFPACARSPPNKA